MFFNGIKAGRRKKTNGNEGTTVTSAKHDKVRESQNSLASATSFNNQSSTTTTISDDVISRKNLSVAEQLRKSLASKSSKTSTLIASNQDDLGRIIQDTACSRTNLVGSFDAESKVGSREDSIVILPGSELFHRKINEDKDFTVHEMVADERRSRTSYITKESQNIMRFGKKRRWKEGTNNDSDEEEQLFNRMMQSSSNTKSDNNNDQRERNRQIALYDRQTAITSKCWWWIECGNDAFQRHRLISIGNYVTLVMAPNNLSLRSGEHFYLVPIQHYQSLASCDDDNVWNEIRHFQNSLRRLFRTEKKSVLFYETVLPTQTFWQTKLECVVVPTDVASDAQLFFKSALTDVAEEWGTHQKLIPTSSYHTTLSSESNPLGNNRRDDGIPVKKHLRHSVPYTFSYFYVEYGIDEKSSTVGDGYVQLIESNQFPKDFGIDTIAGIWKIDPLRFSKKKPSSSKTDEQQIVAKFLNKWKTVDWTVELDGKS